MRKFIINILSFSLFFLIFYAVGIVLLGKLLPSELRPNLKNIAPDYGSTYSMISDLKKEKNVDILVLGASDAYRGYDPRIFNSYGYKIFNLGSSSQTPLQTKILLENYFHKLQPKIVIYEVSPVCFSLDGIESSMDLILNKVDNRIALRLLLKTPDIMLINSYIYSIIVDKLFPIKSTKDFFYTSNEKYITNGYVETKLKFNQKGKVDTVKWIPNPRQVDEFRRICRFFVDKEVSYILVNANNITDRGFSNKNDAYNLFRSNGTFINMENRLILSDSLHFFDNSHLNQNGVGEFNRYLIDNVLCY